MNNAPRSRAKTGVREVWFGTLEAPISIEPLEAATAHGWAHVLSPRELDVALLVARGISNKEVARSLGITEGTVKIHMHSVLRKLGATNRYALLLQTRKNAKQSA